MSSVRHFQLVHPLALLALAKKKGPKLCAVLYDSGTCSSSGWRLDITKGTQKRLKHFSSDWKYRGVMILSKIQTWEKEKVPQTCFWNYFLVDPVVPLTIR